MLQPGYRLHYLLDLGGLGVRRAVQLAPSAFLASAAGCKELVNRILPQSPPYSAASPQGMEQKQDQPPPCTPDNTRQRAWDKPQVQTTSNVLLETAPGLRAQVGFLPLPPRNQVPGYRPCPLRLLGSGGMMKL